jgi:hypothetical protein
MRISLYGFVWIDVVFAGAQAVQDVWAGRELAIDAANCAIS